MNLQYLIVKRKLIFYCLLLSKAKLIPHKKLRLKIVNKVSICSNNYHYYSTLINIRKC